MRTFYRGALMGMMIEKLRGLLHETMVIFIRNSLPNLRVYLLENIEGIVTIEDAVKWAEHFEHAQAKVSIPKVSSLSIEETYEPEDDESYGGIEAFGRFTGGNARRGIGFTRGGRNLQRIVGIGNDPTRKI